MKDVFGDYHELSPGMAELYTLNGFQLKDTTCSGRWLSQKEHAKLNIEALTHLFPTMDRATQARAKRTILNLQEQWTL